MPDTNRVEASFGVDVDVEQLNTLKEKLEGLRPGTVEYSVAWDELKALKGHFLSRLEGECAAYMNIAKEQVNEIFGI